jgi:hypothetical protein
MSEPPQGEIDCPHCHATPSNQDIRVTIGRTDGSAVAIRHTKDCVDYPARAGEEQSGPRSGT